MSSHWVIGPQGVGTIKSWRQSRNGSPLDYTWAWKMMNWGRWRQTIATCCAVRVRCSRGGCVRATTVPGGGWWMCWCRWGDGGGRYIQVKVPHSHHW